MAAALAASLPAPSSAPAPTVPTYEAIPASMSKVIDLEGEIPLQSVQVDGLVSCDRLSSFPSPSVSQVLHWCSSQHCTRVHRGGTYCIYWQCSIPCSSTMFRDLGYGARVY